MQLVPASITVEFNFDKIRCMVREASRDWSPHEDRGMRAQNNAKQYAE